MMDSAINKNGFNKLTKGAMDEYMKFSDREQKEIDTKRADDHADYVRLKDELREKKAKENNEIFFDQKADKIIEDKHESIAGEFKAIELAGELSKRIENKTEKYSSSLNFAEQGSVTERINKIMNDLKKSN